MSEAPPKSSKPGEGTPTADQLEFPLDRSPQADRNWDRGGRSFYFFDFDDNVMHLDTPIFVFERGTGRELRLSTAEFAQVSPMLGQPGPYARFEIDLDDATGSFRRFRDLRGSVDASAQPFVEDLRQALEAPDVRWKGPSWDLFAHAVFNGRPVSVITARGHEPGILRHGLHQLVEAGWLAQDPNYLTVFPVSYPPIRDALAGGEDGLTVAELKMRAIIDSVGLAMERYGRNPYHRFGMSDDSPENVELAVAAMTRLKAMYPENAFFVIDTSRRPATMTEIVDGSPQDREMNPDEQLALF